MAKDAARAGPRRGRAPQTMLQDMDPNTDKLQGHSRTSSAASSIGVAPVPFEHANSINAQTLRQFPRRFSIGIDIGGTLTKISYFEPAPIPGEPEVDTRFRDKIRDLIRADETYGETGQRDEAFEFFSEPLQGRFYFMCFETRKMDTFLAMIRERDILRADTIVCCTGGGARKYAQAIHTLLDVDLPRTDELQCLVDGVNIVLQHPLKELYRIDHRSYRQTQSRSWVDMSHSLFPLLLVNIGSGVSILKVHADGRHQRVGGTAIGGATFYGLCAALTSCDSFDAALQLAAQGDASRVDLLVGDIYGGDYEEYGLSSKTVAASMGKLVRPKDRAVAESADMARGLLDCVTNNVASLAFLHAKQQDIQHVVFAGNFLRHNDISMVRLTAAFDFWSKGELKALFLNHEGYLGSMGALAYGAMHLTTPGARDPDNSTPEPPSATSS